MALLANIVFGTFSDLTRSRFGKRTPWMVAGGLVTGLSIGAVSLTHSEPLIIILWCCAQLGYNMMLAPYVVTMSDRVPDKFRGTVSGFYGAGIAVGQTLGSFVGAQLLKQGEAGIFGGWMMGMAIFSLTGIVVVLIWPREKSNRDEARGELNVRSMLMSFRPPKNAPDFYYARRPHHDDGRLLMINTYQLYIAQDYVFAGDPSANVSKAAELIATMAVITLVVSPDCRRRRSDHRQNRHAQSAGRLGQLPVRRRCADAHALPLRHRHAAVRGHRRTRLRHL